MSVISRSPFSNSTIHFNQLFRMGWLIELWMLTGSAAQGNVLNGMKTFPRRTSSAIQSTINLTFLHSAAINSQREIDLLCWIEERELIGEIDLAKGGWVGWSELCCFVFGWVKGGSPPLAPPKRRQTTTTTHNSNSTKQLSISGMKLAEWRQFSLWNQLIDETKECRQWS